MKAFIIFFFLVLSFIEARKSRHYTSRLTDVDVPTSLVGINATWSFTSGTNITNVTLNVIRLDAGEWAAFGLGQDIAMVNIFNNIHLPYLEFHCRVKLMYSCVKDFLMTRLF